ncbi:hypothetical protein LIER_44004 [Lithospermum erythrorhizon]|uniref:Uncharacterized protein n=1 Tax=Lithospermum erythrorhizon TaxID=34254 RepID=A0AAV3RJG6_LITER
MTFNPNSKGRMSKGGLSHEGVRSLEIELDQAWGEDWKEMAKVKMLKEGDRNTKYFHVAAMLRRRKNRIVGIEDAEGVWQEGSERVEDEVLMYFGDIFRANDICNPKRATSIVDHKVTDEMNGHLTRAVTSEEVRKAVFEMPVDKSFGLDGMTVLFF